MSYTTETMSAEAATYGGVVDAIGGVATVVLAIIALAGTDSQLLLSIAIIVFGAALLIQAGTMLSEFAVAFVPRGAESQPVARFEGFDTGGVSSLFLVGASGIILGILALLGISAVSLDSVAIIAYGAAILISSNAVRQLSLLETARAQASAMSGGQIMASEIASGSAGVQLLAGLATIVLGILAVSGTDTVKLTLVALLVLGSTVVLTGSALSGLVTGFMHSVEPSAQRWHRPAE